MTTNQPLDELLLEELSDIYDAEKQLVKALPALAERTKNNRLKTALNHHFEQTQEQIRRLDLIFNQLGKSAKGKTCAAMRGLIAECEAYSKLEGNQDVIDAGVIGAAQRVEHYEIASYGCARTFAMLCGKNDVAKLLQDSLDEENEADEVLTEIAETGVNQTAADSDRPTKAARREFAAST